VLQPDGSFAEQELAFFRLSQSYYFTEPNLVWPEEGYNGHEFSDIKADLRLRILGNTSFRGHISYNPYDNNLSWYDAILLMQNLRDDYLRLEYRYVRDSLDGFSIRSRLRLNESWVAFFETRRFQSKSLAYLYALEYYAQCWSVRFNIDANSKHDGRDKEIKYGLIFSLSGLGKLGGFEAEMD
jgi:lipopolysaccharide assembly outer membrane protein LptD (OstA)